MCQYFVWTLHISLLAAVVSKWAGLKKSLLAADSSKKDGSSHDRDRIPIVVPDGDVGEDSSDSDEVAPQNSFPVVSLSLITADKCYGMSVIAISSVNYITLPVVLCPYTVA
jgi:hypothetical protein